MQQRTTTQRRTRRTLQENDMHMPTTRRSWRRAAALMAAALLTGCAGDAPAGILLAPRALLDAVEAPPVLPAGCERLAPPTGATLAIRAYARGVQIYRWDGAAWAFVAPAAVLTRTLDGRDAIIIHYGGPTWQALDGGSKVVGAVRQRCTPDASSIAWLLLDNASNAGAAPLGDVTFVQRVLTVGGNAPAQPGAAVGEIVNVPYTAQYVFYRGGK
jgi:hypothetical protein